MNINKAIGSSLMSAFVGLMVVGAASANIDPVAPGAPTVVAVPGGFMYTYQIEVTSAETLVTNNFFTFFDVNGLVPNSEFGPAGFLGSTPNFGPIAIGSLSTSTTTDTILPNVSFQYTGAPSITGQNTFGSFGFISTFGTATTTSGFTAVAQKSGTTVLDSNATTYVGPTPATVPEPAAVVPFALGGLGLLGLIARKTRRTNGAAA